MSVRTVFLIIGINNQGVTVPFNAFVSAVVASRVLESGKFINQLPCSLHNNRKYEDFKSFAVKPIKYLCLGDLPLPNPYVKLTEQWLHINFDAWLKGGGEFFMSDDVLTKELTGFFALEVSSVKRYLEWG